MLKVVFQAGKEKTIVSDKICKSPLYFQRAMYFEQSAPMLAHMYIMSSAGGILQGDRHLIDVTLEEKSMVHITTQGATRVYSMTQDIAMQKIHIKLEDGAYLEYLADQIIPYKDAKYHQELDCTIHENATLFYSEIVTPGRIAMNESFQYDTCHLKAKVENQDKKLLFMDIVDLKPKKQDLRVKEILGDYTIVASIYFFSEKKHVLKLQEQILNLQTSDDVVFASSILAYDSGILIRILANQVDLIQNLILKIAKMVRKDIINASLSVRK